MNKLILIAFLIVSLTGCASLNPGADPVVVRSEQTLSIAFSTFDTFLKIEHDNAATIKAKTPKVHEFAEWLREKDATGTSRGLAFIKSANDVKQAYKRNRTAENKANLVTALATLEAAIAQSQKHLMEIR